MRCPYCGYDNGNDKYLCLNCHEIISNNLVNLLNSYRINNPYAKCVVFEDFSIQEVAQWINSHGANIQILYYRGQLVGYGKNNWQFKFFYVIYNEQPCNEVYEMDYVGGGWLAYLGTKGRIKGKAETSKWNCNWKAQVSEEEWDFVQHRYYDVYYYCSVILRAIPRSHYTQYDYQSPAEISQYAQPAPQYSYQDTSSNGILHKIDNFINSIIDLI